MNTLIAVATDLVLSLRLSLTFYVAITNYSLIYGQLRLETIHLIRGDKYNIYTTSLRSRGRSITYSSNALIIKYVVPSTRFYKIV